MPFWAAVVLEVVAAVWFGALVRGLCRSWRELRQWREWTEAYEARRVVGGFGGGEQPLSEGEIEPPPVGPPQRALWSTASAHRAVDDEQVG